MFWDVLGNSLKLYIKKIRNSKNHELVGSPRKGQAFPTSLGGKAFDTAVVMAWLESEMDGEPKAMVIQKKHGSLNIYV